LTKTAPEGVIFGQRLRELRIARNFSQGELADRCGSNRPFISNLERGVKVPSLTMILRLADGLDCPVYDLVEVFDKNNLLGKRAKPEDASASADDFGR
jgi:transcriptional regulator with XRE-family HTH domain